MDLYEALNINKSATKEQIKKAYRWKAKGAHPDRGGNAEDFHRISTAYTVLMNDQKKAHYDETGNYNEKVNNIDQQAFQELFALINKVISELIAGNVDVIYKNVIKTVHAGIKQGIDRTVNIIKDAKKKAKNLEKLKKRFNYTGDKINIVDGVFDQQSKALAIQIKQQEDVRIIGEKMLELLKDYEFRVDEKDQDDFTLLRNGIFRYVKVDTSSTGAW